MIYELPLTRASGKIRIKERLTFADYGKPVAPLQTIMTPRHYIEWQIGYDVVAQTGEQWDFIGANGQKKRLFELSEILRAGFQSGWISRAEFENLRDFIVQNTELVEQREEITRTHFKEATIAGMAFLRSVVSYPLLVYKFAQDGLGEQICEIIVREKQRAVGVMPMLYFCLPVSALQNDLIGRQVASKELGRLEISAKNIAVFVELLRIFGILSEKHRADCLKIIEVILK